MEDKRVSKRIFLFYRWGLRVIPILLMLAHWMYVGISSHLPEAHITTGGVFHLIPLYVMAYVFPIVFMLPASYFFKFCLIWRVPFIYLAGVNALHICNATLVCTPQMAGQCKILAYVVLVLYTICIVQKVPKI